MARERVSRAKRTARGRRTGEQRRRTARPFVAIAFRSSSSSTRGSDVFCVHFFLRLANLNCFRSFDFFFVFSAFFGPQQFSVRWRRRSFIVTWRTEGTRRVREQERPHRAVVSGFLTCSTGIRHYSPANAAPGRNTPVEYFRVNANVFFVAIAARKPIAVLTIVREWYTS